MEPEDFVESYERALATQNWKNVEPLVHTNANVTFSNGIVHKGKAEVKIAFEKNFSTIKSEMYAMKNLRWLLKNTSTAVYLFDFHWRGVIKNKAVQGNGVGTSVLTKEQGTWQLLTEHLGSNSSS